MKTTLRLFSLFAFSEFIRAFLIPCAGSAESAPVSWERTLQQAAFVKEGMTRFHNPQYHYKCLGLGGTTMRVSPNGFTKPDALWLHPGVYLTNQLYLAYRYQWDEEGHRDIPFHLSGGNGKALEPGQRQFNPRPQPSRSDAEIHQYETRSE